MVDNDAVTLIANPALCTILGRPQEEIVGRQIFDFVDEENRLIFLNQLEKRKKGKSGAYEISLQRSDGVNVPCLFNATPFLDEKGAQKGLFRTRHRYNRSKSGRGAGAPRQGDS